MKANYTNASHARDASPNSSEDGLSMRSGYAVRREKMPARDDGPLIPQQAQPLNLPQPLYRSFDPPSSQQDRNPPASQPRQPRYNYASPITSGTQLAPIEEVRPSMESDRSHVQHLMHNNTTMAVSSQRKVSGPRLMSVGRQDEGNGSKRTGLVEAQPPKRELMGTVRRKPIRSGLMA